MANSTLVENQIKGLRELTLKAGGRRIAVQHRQGQGVPVVASHGWLDNSNTWLPLLRHHYKLDLYAIDLPGHGKSEAKSADAGLAFWDQVLDLRLIINALGFDRFHLLGHSMGAAISMLYAACFPEQLTSLMLIEGLGPMVEDPKAAVSRLRDSVLQREKHPTGPASKSIFQNVEEAASRRQQQAMNPISLEAASLLSARNLVTAEDGWRWNFDPKLKWPSMLRMTLDQAKAFLDRVSVPTFVGLGESGLFTAAFVESVLGPTEFELHWYPGGHHFHMEHEGPSLLATDLQTWLAKHT